MSSHIYLRLTRHKEMRNLLKLLLVTFMTSSSKSRLNSVKGNIYFYHTFKQLGDQYMTVWVGDMCTY